MREEIEKHEIICPCCEGKGKMPILDYNKRFVDEKRKTAKALLKRGFSFRSVQKILGYKSVRSVQTLVIVKKKKK